jgi:hypothetical protein
LCHVQRSLAGAQAGVEFHYGVVAPDGSIVGMVAFNSVWIMARCATVGYYLDERLIN